MESKKHTREASSEESERRLSRPRTQVRVAGVLSNKRKPREGRCVCVLVTGHPAQQNFVQGLISVRREGQDEGA